MRRRRRQRRRRQRRRRDGHGDSDGASDGASDGFVESVHWTRQINRSVYLSRNGWRCKSKRVNEDDQEIECVSIENVHGKGVDLSKKLFLVAYVIQGPGEKKGRY